MNKKDPSEIASKIAYLVLDGLFDAIYADTKQLKPPEQVIVLAQVGCEIAVRTMMGVRGILKRASKEEDLIDPELLYTELSIRIAQMMEYALEVETIK